MPVLLGFYCIGLDPGLRGALLLAFSLFLSVSSGVFSRVSLLSASAAVMIVNYLVPVTANLENSRLWSSIAYGAIIFLYVEIGYDSIRVLHHDVDAQTYRIRGIYLAKVVALSSVVTIVFATIAFNLVHYFPGVFTSRISLIAAVALTLCLGILLLVRIRKPD